MNPKPSDQARPEILIVDDDVQAIEELSLFLVRQGYEIHSAETGAAAIEIAAERPISFVLSDVRMPGIGIEDTLAGVRKGAKCQIALMTGQPDKGQLLDQEELGVLEILRKPLDLRKVRDLIQQALADEN
jgi:DNA-binding NtrC family response regulator